MTTYRSPSVACPFLAVIACALVITSCSEDSGTQPSPPQNTQPIADAGPDQSLGLPGMVTLDGSASQDADGDALEYRWDLFAVPAASAAVLSDSTATMPTFTADVVGDYLTKLVVSDGELDSEPDTVTVTLDPTPRLQPFSRTIGAGLQFASDVSLSTANHGGVTVRIESSDPSVALVAPNVTTPGSAFIDVAVSDGVNVAPYVVQGVAGRTGTVTITTSSLGFASGNGTIEVVQAAVDISGLEVAQSVGINDAFIVFTGPLNTAGTALESFQGVSAANAPLDLTATSSNGTIGELNDTSGTTGATIMIVLGADVFQQSVVFEPLSDGMTTVSVSIPSFVSVPTASVGVTVGLPGITPFSRTIGASLQFAGSAGLGEANHGGVTVRVESGDPATALVASDGVTPGAAFIDVIVADGVDIVPYVVQGVAGTTGTVTITGSAAGFAVGTGTIDVVPGGVAISGLEDTRSAGRDDAFTILAGPLNDAGTELDGFQRMSAANVPPLVLTVTSSNGTAGQVSRSGDTGATIMFDAAADEGQWSVIFQPLSVGATTVTASIPGFASLGAVDIAVDPPNITPFSRAIGAGLQFGSSAGLDIANHGGVTVRIESDDPSVALIAPDPATAGSVFIDVFVADGLAVAPYVVQGIAGATGTVTVSASATGFDTGTGTNDVVQSGVVISALASDRSVGVNDVFTVLIGIPNGAGTALSGFQGASAANNPPLVLTVMSSAGAVGELTDGGSTGATLLIQLAAGEFQPNVTFVPLAAGMTTVSASIPGFLSTTGATVDVTVSP